VTDIWHKKRNKNPNLAQQEQSPSEARKKSARLFTEKVRGFGGLM